jgi:hypothetical protein
MKANKIKIISSACICAISIILILVVRAVALEVETHKTINSYIADENSVIYGSYLDNYLKNDLKMQEGIKTIFNSKMVKEWITYGGET